VLGEGQQAHHLLWRVLQVVVHSDDMGAAGVPQACHHRIVLPKIPRKTDERDGHTRPVDERAAHFEAVVGAAIIDEDNLVTAGDREFLERPINSAMLLAPL
jgi:hypothetical protein